MTTEASSLEDAVIISNNRMEQVEIVFPGMTLEDEAVLRCLADKTCDNGIKTRIIPMPTASRFAIIMSEGEETVRLEVPIVTVRQMDLMNGLLGDDSLRAVFYPRDATEPPLLIIS